VRIKKSPRLRAFFNGVITNACASILTGTALEYARCRGFRYQCRGAAGGAAARDAGVPGALAAAGGAGTPDADAYHTAVQRVAQAARDAAGTAAV